MQTVSRVLAHGRTELAKVIVGQEELINQCLLTILCGGHALLEGVPGIAKTLVIKLFARLFDLQFRRVQCTSDLMPADIIGSNVLNLSTSTFALHRGPLFTDLLLADEVNRMPPRTQAALLEAMEERQITIDNTSHRLSEFFTVFATQNPVEFEGTYPLPEAQLDRFLLKIKIGYPTAGQEITILQNHHQGFDAHHLEAVQIVPIPVEDLAQARVEVRNTKVEPALFRYLVDIVRRTRDWPALAMGASPRAAISLMMVAKAAAALEERDYLIPDDVKSAALPVLRHRVVMKPEAELEGLDSDRALAELIGSVEVPK
ncbi:MAG TPA: MoxR family ATPase [Candidatus Saccharimonadales bacterium]|jgi:MoxR-like ATPase|nr:MoxR family ATPase [Candidatus Saccharimonadales bacterium]